MLGMYSYDYTGTVRVSDLEDEGGSCPLRISNPSMHYQGNFTEQQIA